MNVQTIHGGPPLTGALLRRFELQTGSRVPTPVVWFLTNIANGGCSMPRRGFRLRDEIDGLDCLHGLYGIGAAVDCFDLGLALTYPAFQAFQRAFPIGSDGGEGFLCYIKSGEFEGQIRLFYQDESFEGGSEPETFFVAANIQEFAEQIGELVCPDDED